MGNEVFKDQKNQGRLEDAGEFPRVVLVDTVSLCNLKCSMCVHKEMTRKRGIMPWDLFRRIIDEVAEADNTVRVWMVFFGEALILKRRRPSIFDMISYAKGKGLKDVVLNSNANLLDKKAARRIIESGLDAIYIGIDAFSPETYMKIRVGGNYARVVNNTRYLLELKRELGSKKPEVFVQFVEMDVNRAEKEDFIDFWKKAGAGVKIRPKVSWAGRIEAPNLVMDEKDRWPCYWAMRTLSITDTGKVVTCAVDLDARFVAGDVNLQSLREIWNGKLKELRQLHQSRQFEALPENCEKCKDWQAARADYYWVNP
jgi:radical SAM protein with 4Fe4S-binding SPASM domain